MDDLPDVPFKKILSYLNFRDRLQLGGVSRSCRVRIHNSRVKTLCFSSCPRDFILGKNRWVSGAFAQNFIKSTKFASFFDAYRHSILSSLKHLRLCDFELRGRAVLIRALNSFSQLEELTIVRFKCSSQQEFSLTLPMLISFHLQETEEMPKITLDAPRLQVVTVQRSFVHLEIVHDESVEKLIRVEMGYVEVMKNLKYIYENRYSTVYLKLLPQLKHLKEFHLENHHILSELFVKRQQCGRADLKIYFRGLLVNGLNDPAIDVMAESPHPECLGERAFVKLAENPSRLADEIPFYHELSYSAIERVAPGMEVEVLKRFTYLNEFKVRSQVQDIERFLDLLKKFKNIVKLEFRGDHPQELFDRLPEYCALQCLTIHMAPSDLTFLFRLKHLVHLELDWIIDAKLARKTFEQLPFLSKFNFRRDPSLGYFQNNVKIEIDRLKRIRTWPRTSTFSDLNSAIQAIFHPSKIKTRKRRAEQLE